MKAAASDGVPHHKSEGAAPATKTKGDGHSRNILRKGGPAVERKAGTSGHALQDPSMEGAPPVDPNPYQGVTLFFAALALSGVACSLLLNSDPFVYHALNRRGGMLPSATPSPTASP